MRAKIDFLLSNTGNNTVNARVKDFFYGYYYPLLLSIITIISYSIGTFGSFIGFTVLAAGTCISLILFKDITTIFPPVLLFIMNFNDLSLIYHPYFCVISVIVGLFIAAHFVLYPPERIFIGKLFFPLIIVSVALFCGGLLSDYLKDYPQGIESAISVGPVILFEYFLFSNYIKPPENFDIKHYLCILVITAALTASATMFIYYIKHSIFRIGGDVGWGSTNAVSPLILLALPCACYLLTRSFKQLPYFALIVLLFVCMFCTESDGALGIMCACTPFLIVTTYFNSINRKKFAFVSSICITLGIILLFIVCIAFDIFSIINTSDSGRLTIYKKAVELYKKYPLFGVGLGYKDLNAFNPALSSFRQNNFHSVVLHVMATMGTVGLVSYIFYFVCRYKIFIGNSSRFNVYMTYAFTLFEFYALIDTGEFVLFPLLCTITLITCVTEYTSMHASKNRSIRNNFIKTTQFDTTMFEN